MVVINNFSKTNILLLYLTTTFYKLLGLAPFSLKTLPVIRNKTDQITIQFLGSFRAKLCNVIGYFVVMPIELYYFCTTINYRVTEKNSTQYYFDIFLGIAVQILQVTIILLFTMKQKVIVTILNKLLYFESELVEKLNDLNQCYSGKYLQISIFIGFFSINLGHILSEYMVLKSNCLINIMIYIFPEFIIRYLTIQYAIVLIFIKKKYFILNESLLSLSNPKIEFRRRSVNDLTDVRNKENIIERLIFIRKAYHSLEAISAKVSEFYSMPICIAVGYYCLEVIYSTYSLTLELKEKETLNIPECINWSLIAVACLYPTIVLTNSVTSVHVEVSF